MIKSTKETIFHYTCDECDNWWSYATSETYTPESMICPHCGALDDVTEEGRRVKKERAQPGEWIRVEDDLPVAPLGRVHVLIEEEYIGQGMPQPPTKMLRMGSYSSEFCEAGESGYWEDDYGNRIEVEQDGGVNYDRVTHWAKLIPEPAE